MADTYNDNELQTLSDMVYETAVGALVEASSIGIADLYPDASDDTLSKVEDGLLALVDDIADMREDDPDRFDRSDALSRMIRDIASNISLGDIETPEAAMKFLWGDTEVPTMKGYSADYAVADEVPHWFGYSIPEHYVLGAEYLPGDRVAAVWSGRFGTVLEDLGEHIDVRWDDDGVFSQDRHTIRLTSRAVNIKVGDTVEYVGDGEYGVVTGTVTEGGNPVQYCINWSGSRPSVESRADLRLVKSVEECTNESEDEDVSHFID